MSEARFYSLFERPLIQDEGFEYWGNAPGTIGAVDLAPVAGHSYVFGTSDQPFDANDVAVNIGDGARLGEYMPSASERSAWTSLLGVAWTPGWTLLDALWAVLTTQSDPDGELRAKPIMPTHKGVLELHLGGHSLIRSARMPRKPTDTPHWSAMQRVLQNDYRAIQQRNATLARKWLGAMQLKYRLTAEAARDLLIPQGLPRELPQRPTTTIGDDFTDVSDTLMTSHTPTGGNSGWGSWSHTSGSLKISNNEFMLDAGSFGEARADADLSSDDHYSQIDKTVAGGASNDNVRVLSRFHGTDRTHYGLIRGGDFAQLFKRIAGALTTFTGVTHAEATPEQVRVTTDGSTLTATIGGVVADTQTDTAITGNLRAGIAAQTSNRRADNFEASDLVAASSALLPILQNHGAFL